MNNIQKNETTYNLSEDEVNHKKRSSYEGKHLSSNLKGNKIQKSNTILDDSDIFDNIIPFLNLEDQCNFMLVNKKLYEKTIKICYATGKEKMDVLMKIKEHLLNNTCAVSLDRNFFNRALKKFSEHHSIVTSRSLLEKLPFKTMNIREISYMTSDVIFKISNFLYTHLRENSEIDYVSNKLEKFINKELFSSIFQYSNSF